MRIFQKKGILFDIQPKRIYTIRTAITETAMFIFLSPVPLLRSAGASLCHSERRSVRASAIALILGNGDQAHREPVIPAAVEDAVTIARVEVEAEGAV